MTTQFYCAICSGPAGIWAIGSSSPKALKRRRKYVEAKRLEKATGQRVRIDFGNDESSNDESDEAPYNPNDLTRYDPGLVGPESTEWLHDIYCLGVDDWTGEGFIKGPVTSQHNLNSVTLVDGEGSLDTYFCYTTINCVFPFHLCCFELLLYSIFNDIKFDNIDKKVLYKVMMDINPGQMRLDMDYGDIEGPDQYWISEPGEEYCVAHPTSFDGEPEEFLRDKIKHDDTFRRPSADIKIDLRHAVVDPFGSLPAEVLLIILDMLPPCSLFELAKLSASVCRAIQPSRYWKQRMYREMKWFWELPDLLQDQSDLNFKALYLWLDKKTTPEIGMDTKFMGLGNRRRIWGACQQLRELYSKAIPPNAEGEQ